MQGESFASVYRALDEAIAAYLDTVQDLPEDARVDASTPGSTHGRAARSLQAGPPATLLGGARTDAQYADFTLPVAA
ncbi:MAG: hypothetical protein U5L06_14360 [Rhodovibrio sp.]|nr:hypothetical protein [Rhodovibrio sp.]